MKVKDLIKELEKLDGEKEIGRLNSYGAVKCVTKIKKVAPKEIYNFDCCDYVIY